MTDFETYLNYLALKLHFEGKYDYFKYGGKTSATIESFKKRKDKHQFVKLSRKLSDEQIKLLEKKEKLVEPSWYENKWLYFVYGAGIVGIPAYNIGKGIDWIK